jgi:putative DNA primase/helicase
MIDYDKINAAARSRLDDLLPQWLPSGRIEGNEYRVGSLKGEEGKSCSVNRVTGKWADFATDEKGGDPISLWAAIRGIKQGEAARELARTLGLEVDKPARKGRRRVVASYDYLGPDGKLIFQVTRWEPKTFSQRRPDGNGGWINSVKDIELVPYHLPKIVQAKAVFIVEGEKDAEALTALGLTATCNAQGAGKWRAEYNRHFADKRVCILPDNDDPGRKHARDVARQLHGLAEVVKVIELPGLPPKGDVSDWLAAGGTRESLLEMVKATPAWEPTLGPLDARNDEDDHEDGEGIIRIIKGSLGETVDACEAILAQPDLPTQYKMFQRGGQLVRVVTLPASDLADGVARPQGAVVIQGVQKPFILDVLGRFGRFEKFDGRSREWRTADPPKEVAETILARAGLWPVPVLRGVVASPTLRADGSLLLAPGYDPSSGYYLAHTLQVSVPAAPTQTDARTAFKFLAQLLSGFSFISSVDLAVAMGFIVTAVVRTALPTAPLFGITAPVRGSGKSTLADVAAVIATGHIAPVLSATKDHVELEKRVVGSLLAGDNFINLDNISGILSSDLLSQAMTSAAVKIRPLGTSSHVNIPNTALWCANGNNLLLTGDLTRRALLCCLDPRMEHPEERSFDFDPVARALEQRGDYVTAVLTMVRAYIVAGHPNLGLTPFGSFGHWSNVVRSALVWIGAEDPCKSRMTVLEEDPDAGKLSALLSTWRDCFGGSPMTVKELIKTSRDGDSPITEVLFDIAGEGQEINNHRLGRWLRRHAERIVDGFKLVKFSPVSGVAQWKVLPASR